MYMIKVTIVHLLLHSRSRRQLAAASITPIPHRRPTSRRSVGPLIKEELIGARKSGEIKKLGSDQSSRDIEEGGMEVGGGGRGREDRDDDEVCREQERAAAVQVYCAVGRDAVREWRANLRWVLANFPRRHRRLVLVLVHVHRPPHRLNMMGAWVPVSKLAESEVAAYRKLEEDKANKALDDLVHICKIQQVHARKVVIVGDDVARGLVQLVEDHGVAELVMGAAAARAYTRKMRAPKSKKAVTVQRKANPRCRIWFVCKGNLICTRELIEEQSRAEPSKGSTSPRSSASDYSRSKSSHDDESLDTMTASLCATMSRDGGSDNAIDHIIQDSSQEATAETVHAKAGSSVGVQLRSEGEEEPPTPSRHGSARDAENSVQGEARHQREAEEQLARERAAVERDRQELEATLGKTREADVRSPELELQVTCSDHAMGELDVKMSESCSGLNALRLERPCEEPAAEEGSMAAVALGRNDRSVDFLRLDLAELVEATNSFDESARIGGAGGARGGVYRGTLHGMSVAVKIFSPDVAINEARFAHEADAMARARHPGLVTLVGACPEARAVVQELVTGGSLEDRLDGEASPLPWHARCGVAYRTCSALSYLHSTAMVHGDLRPANILFEDERCSSSKLAGLGMSRLATTKHAGRVALAYVDPRYLSTGELTPQCDVHALGLVLLRLVTGKPASAAKKAAWKAATGRGRAWHEVADASAGGWPMERATEVVILGLKCCHVSDGRRPPRPAVELLDEARSVLEAVTSTAPGRTWSSMSSSFDPQGGDEGPADRRRRVHVQGGSDEGVAGERARHVADDQPRAPYRHIGVVPHQA